MSIKPYFNERGWTDVAPFELVRVVSEKTVEIRGMDAVLDESWKPEFIPGGFFGHTANNSEQKWVITSNPSNLVFRIRLDKKGKWKNKYGTEYRNADAPRKFHDYNF
jgi:hypothetical protein